MNQYRIIYRFLKSPILILTLLIAGCTEIDDYKKYIEGGEISYTGKIEEVEVHPGLNRIELMGLLKSDPKVTDVKLYWNSNKDSASVKVNRTSGIDTVRFLLGQMEENVHSFSLVTLDAKGNKSVPVNKTGKVYGEKYILSIMNRLVRNAEVTPQGIVMIFGDASYLNGIIGTEISYTTNQNFEAKARIAASGRNDTILLADYKLNSPVYYRSLYLPEPVCIDTFYTKSKKLSLTEDVTKTYLKNTGPDVQYSGWDGKRWGNLADWTVNDAIKNASGYGGYELRSGKGIISMEAGWGLPAVLNGKIYQSVELPAGNYRFEIDLNSNGAAGVKYIAVNRGSDLVDFDKVTTQSLSYAEISAKEVLFTLNENATVSIGFVCNLPGNGEYCKVAAVRLFRLPS
jgi:hypothetical protein